MDPIIASGLVNLGKNLVESVLPGNDIAQLSKGIKNVKDAASLDFSSLLGQSGKKGMSNISAQELSNLKSTINELYQKFLADPTLMGNFIPKNDSDVITMSLNKGNKLALSNQSGQRVELNLSSDLAEMAHEMFDLKNQMNEGQGLSKTSTLQLTRKGIS